ncbi:intradiol ring-cleavage dioxygenase [Streptomyces turgidiscabies]|uniref:Dioxygenase n=1 Tax=Streptomyces turgidiscabies (strain Car8) TaxID=698760 RepID=L7EUJ0_STRT8|nr:MULTISPECIES: intradiol ring-cleavage dioxygenase [Streptomyces]ELP63063.1 dioxygenase [Streptomyces turgidiscabies Car8]MDX3494167.1 intradiol ring-cleavage dioxygenase [Streptomyces turgidiscabies]GAQ68460.1 dioxygenase [Streptomyces turgidiscabies]
MTENTNPQSNAPEASADTTGAAGSVGKHRLGKTVQRRRVLIGGGTAAVVGGLAVAGFASAAPTAPAEKSSSATTSSSDSSSSTSSSSTTSSVCVLNAEVTEGPYSLDGALVRADIREEKEGFEVRYTFTVVDVADDCAPLADALVEIWHCDHLGEYSGFVGGNGHQEEDNGTFLRGGQLTDADGQCTITSIWPGHYVSRAVHVHMRVHTDVTLTDTSYTGGEVIHTGQLFFDEAINTTVQATSPYSANTTSETTLSDDSIYDDGGASSGLLTLTALGSSVSDGYTATLTVGVDS